MINLFPTNDLKVRHLWKNEKKCGVNRVHAHSICHPCIAKKTAATVANSPSSVTIVSKKCKCDTCCVLVPLFTNTHIPTIDQVCCMDWRHFDAKTRRPEGGGGGAEGQ